MDKKKNMKIYITFVVIMIICLLGGFFAGRFASNIQGEIDMIDWNGIAQKMYIPLIITFAALEIIVHGLGFIVFKQAKGKYETLENASDEIFETEIIAVEKKLNAAMIINYMMILFSFVIFPFIIICSESITSDNISRNGLIMTIMIYIVVLVLFMTLYVYIMNLEKKINPEKKGNPLDIHFRKQWLKSMDEAQLMKNALGSQKACTAGIMTGFVLWVISFVCMLVFHTGILPIFCVIVMMGVILFVQAINSI